MESDYFVTKSNDFISAHYDLSAEEQKLILTLASLVQPDDETFKPYTFRIKDFTELLGISTHSRYTQIQQLTKSLLKRVLEINDGSKKLQLAWLSSACYDNGELTLCFDPNLKPYLLKLNKFFTSYRLENILTLKSKYSIRLYEILKSYQFKNYVVITIDELRKMLGIKDGVHSDFRNFEKRVLKVPQDELRKKTDLKFTYEKIKKGRKITAIKFYTAINNADSKNQVNMHDIICDDDNDTLNLIDRVKKTINADFHINALKKLIKDKGIEKIEYYLENWHKFDCISKKNISGYFYEAVMGEYTPPEQQQGSNVKPVQATNYEQRNYEEEDFDIYYWQPEHDLQK